MSEVVVERKKLATQQQRDEAIALLLQDATLREAAEAVGVSHEAVRLWAQAEGIERRRRLPRSMRPRPVEPVAPGQREPVYVNGVRLGRLALWT